MLPPRTLLRLPATTSVWLGCCCPRAGGMQVPLAPAIAVAVPVPDQTWGRITEQQASVLLMARTTHGVAQGWQTTEVRYVGEEAYTYLLRAYSAYLSVKPVFTPGQDVSENYGLPANMQQEVRFCRVCDAWMLGRRSNHVASAVHRAAVTEQQVQRGRLEERARVLSDLSGMPQEQLHRIPGMTLLLASLTTVLVVTDVSTGGGGLRRLITIFLRPEMVAWWDQRSLLSAWVVIVAVGVLLVGVTYYIGWDGQLTPEQLRERRRLCPILYSRNPATELLLSCGILFILFIGAPLLMKFGFGYDWQLIFMLYLGYFLALVCMGGCTRLLGLHKT
jgi:hypothetical protein